MKLFYFVATTIIFCLLGNLVSAQTRGVYLKADDLTKNGSPANPAAYRDYVEVNDFRFGAEHPVTRVARQFKGDVPSFKEVTFSQISNVNSNPFRSRLMNALSIERMDFINLRSEGQSTSGVVYKVELKEVMITSATTTISDDGIPVDTFTATFTAARVTTYIFDSKSGTYTATTPFIFNQDSQSADF